MKKVRLTESDLINIVKRVLKEEEGQPTTCTGNYDQPKGSLFVLDRNLYFQYIDKTGNSIKCQVPNNELKTSSIKIR